MPRISFFLLGVLAQVLLANQDVATKGLICVEMLLRFLRSERSEAGSLGFLGFQAREARWAGRVLVMVMVWKGMVDKGYVGY